MRRLAFPELARAGRGYSSHLGKVWPVSTCITGTETAGRNAFRPGEDDDASLPPENSSTGRRSAATSRMVGTDSGLELVRGASVQGSVMRYVEPASVFACRSAALAAFRVRCKGAAIERVARAVDRLTEARVRL